MSTALDLICTASITGIIWLFAYLAAKSLTRWGLVILAGLATVIVVLVGAALGADDDTMAAALLVTTTAPLWATAIAWLHDGEVPRGQ